MSKLFSLWQVPMEWRVADVDEERGTIEVGRERERGGEQRFPEK